MTRVDVVVVGAGAAGLACASALADRDLSVVVLEARDRVGGRILTLRHPGEAPLEAGAQVVHGEHALTWRVLEVCGVEAVPLDTKVPFAITVDGRRHDAQELAPWNLHLGAEDRPVTELLDGDGLRERVATAWLAQSWCADPARLSAAGIAAVGAGWRAGRSDYVVPGGYDEVLRRLAVGLDVRLNAPAERIAWRAGVEVAGTRGLAVVVTVPPPAVSRLLFDPPLPPAKARARELIEVGDAMTVVATWSAPSDRDALALSVDAPSGFWQVRAGSRLVQCVLKGRAAATARRTGLDFEVAGRLAFPWLRGEATGCTVVDWGEDAFARCGFCFPTTAALEAQRIWAEPVAGTLFFAGDATCGARHPGTVHGALESGVRAAVEVASAIAHPQR